MRKRLIGERYGTKVRMPSWTCPLAESARYCMVRSRLLSLSASGLTTPTSDRFGLANQLMPCNASLSHNDTSIKGARQGRAASFHTLIRYGWLLAFALDGFRARDGHEEMNSISGSAGLIRKRFTKNIQCQARCRDHNAGPMVLHPGLRATSPET